MAVDLAYRFFNDNRITVAGQRLILTDFAFQPSLSELQAPLLYSIVKLQVFSKQQVF
jgi:hypothetical protein